MVNKDKKPIQFKLIDIKKLSYFENDPSTLGIKEKKIKNSSVDYGANVHIDSDSGTVSIQTMAKFYIEKDGKRFELFGIETRHVFKIRNFPEVIQGSEENVYLIPDEIMLTFMNISISGMRGMLAVLNSRIEYNQLYFPIINSASLLEGIKKND